LAIGWGMELCQFYILMMENKIKFSDIMSNEEVSIKELSVLKGGGAPGMPGEDGCRSGICTNDRETGIPYCDGGAICTNGIG